MSHRSRRRKDNLKKLATYWLQLLMVMGTMGWVLFWANWKSDSPGLTIFLNLLATVISVGYLFYWIPLYKNAIKQHRKNNEIIDNLI